MKRAKTEYKISPVESFDGCFYNNIQLLPEKEIDFRIEKISSKTNIMDEDTFWDSITDGKSTHYLNDTKFQFPPSPLCDLTRMRSTLRY